MSVFIDSPNPTGKVTKSLDFIVNSHFKLTAFWQFLKAINVLF